MKITNNFFFLKKIDKPHILIIRWQKKYGDYIEKENNKTNNVVHKVKLYRENHPLGVEIKYT